MVEKFEDLTIFKKASDLSVDIYKITRNGVFRYDPRFVQQIRAAVGPIMDNIAEGFECDGNKEFINFLYIAKGSCREVRSQLIRAHRVGFIDEQQYQDLYNRCIKESTGIANLIRSIKNTKFKGKKYNESKISSKGSTSSEGYEPPRMGCFPG